MKSSRFQRYSEKIQFIEDRLKNVEIWLKDAADDEKSKFAVYKCFQEAVEGITDVFSMILKDEKRIVKDDYMNFEEIRKLKILDSSLKSSITEANGLRNRLVHEYNGISDAIALDSIKDLIDDIYKIIKRVKKWLAK